MAATALPAKPVAKLGYGRLRRTNPAEAEQLHVGSGGSLDAIWHAAWNNFLKHLVAMQAHVCCWIFQSFHGHTF